VLDAFVKAFVCDNSDDENFNELVSFSEEKLCSYATFRIPPALFKAVKAKYEKRCGTLAQDRVFMYVLADALKDPNYKPNLERVDPAFNFVGQKNPAMRDKTNSILNPRNSTTIMSQENILYFEPFCGTASLFLALPLQPTWKYVLNDLNKNKVNLLRAIKHHPYELLEKTLRCGYKNDKFKIFNPKQKKNALVVQEKLAVYATLFKKNFKWAGTDRELADLLEWYEKTLHPTGTFRGSLYHRIQASLEKHSRSGAELTMNLTHTLNGL
jgi:hypothetical protein